jgi:hypothetical protein
VETFSTKGLMLSVFFLPFDKEFARSAGRIKEFPWPRDDSYVML